MELMSRAVADTHPRFDALRGGSAPLHAFGEVRTEVMLQRSNIALLPPAGRERPASMRLVPPPWLAEGALTYQMIASLLVVTWSGAARRMK